MGALARAFSLQPSRRSIENPATSLSDPAQWLADWATGGQSDSGIPVNENNAVTLSAVWCAVRILAESLASLPLYVMERGPGRGRRKAFEHPVTNLLHLEPNPSMTSFFFREVSMAKVVLHGNAYAPIVRDQAGRPRELWPLVNESVKVERLNSGELIYRVRMKDGRTESWLGRDMLHVPGLSFNGLEGKSVLAAAREGIGLGLAAQKYGSIYFRRGGRVPGVIETQFPQLSPDQRRNLREGWDQSVGSQDNWHKVAILDRGMVYKEIGIKPDDGQWLQTRKFQVTEIARFFRVAPHLLYDLEKATFSNIEQMGLEFIMHTMRPWLVRWEQELARKLLTPEERPRLYVQFNIDGLQRGDITARGAYYTQGRQWGWLSANDVLDLEDRPGIGDQGEVYLTPFNMLNAAELVGGSGGAGDFRGRPDPGSAAGGEPPGPSTLPDARLMLRAGLRGLRLRRRIRSAQVPVIEDRARLIVKRETGAMRKEVQKLLGPDPRNRRNLSSLREAIEAFYEQHAGWAAQRMRPVILNYAELINAAMADELGTDDDAVVLPPQLERWVQEYTERFGAREASEGRLQLEALTTEGDETEVAGTVLTRLDEWEEKRPRKIALLEATQAMSGTAMVLMVVAGVTLFRWVASSGACPFCKTLDGKVVGREQNFVDGGGSVDAGADAGPPMKSSMSIGHPPLHSNCECDIVAD